MNKMSEPESFFKTEKTNFIQVRKMSITSLEYVWERFESNMDTSLKIIKHTVDEEKYEKIKSVIKITLDKNIVKTIVETKDYDYQTLYDLKGEEESLYARYISQIRILPNKLLNSFLRDLNYLPDVEKPNSLTLFNCLNLDLRKMTSKIKDDGIESINYSILGKNHNFDWYKPRFRDLEQVYWTFPQAFTPLRNDSQHADDDPEVTHYDFITKIDVPANTIVMANTATLLIHFCLEILTTWIKTYSIIGILNPEKIKDILKNETI
jgi:predicted transcriptional regulator